MSILSGVVIGLLMGVVFGFAFEKSRMMEPGSLIGQFQFRRFIMMKMLFAASRRAWSCSPCCTAPAWCSFR